MSTGQPQGDPKWGGGLRHHPRGRGAPDAAGEALERLGPTYGELGRLLSPRPDLAAGSFIAATLLGLYMVWKIIRTPGEL